jgi:citrate lyase subunit beta/citryl-CoA lyase
MTKAVWRSLMYVPTHVEKFVGSAHTRGADAIILDLEDAVPPDEKVRARGLVQSAAEQVGQAGADVLVRINQGMALALPDIEAAVSDRVAALYLPKVESAAEVVVLEEAVAKAEEAKGLPVGRTGLVVLIESALGFLSMVEIARASPRVLALSLGSEDFALDLGMEANDETLFAYKQQLILAAAAAKVSALGVIGAQTSFADPEAYRAMARRSRAFGFAGSSCIHPKQVALLNEGFSPTEKEVAYAERVVAEAAEAERAGRGAFAIDGQMIDAPIVERARRLIGRVAAIRAREERLKALAN